MSEPEHKAVVPSRRKGGDVWTCLLLAIVCLFAYNANLRSVSAVDTYSTRYLPFNILSHHTLYLDGMTGLVIQGADKVFWIINGRNEHAISLYPVVTPLLITPLYIPAAIWLHKNGWTDGGLNFAARIMEKLSASLIASFSVALIYLLLRRRVDVRIAILLTLAYAFGTNTWMIGSQAFWQHGMGELLLVVCLLLVTGSCTAGRAFWAGLVCALIVFNRPPDAILAAALGLYGFWWAGRRALWAVVGAIIIAIPLLAYNFLAAGSIGGGYAIMGNHSFFRFDILPGLAGLLFSPGRGLFVFTPFLLFLPFGLRRALDEPRTRVLAIFLCIAIVLQLLVYAKADWRGGSCWGPRWLTDILPLLVWMLAPVVAAMGRIKRAAFIATAGISIAIQAVGAFWYVSSSDAAIMAVGSGPGLFDAAWDIRNTPFLAELRHRHAPRDLLLRLDGGNIDSVKAGNREVTNATQGTEIAVEGWAPADHRSPASVSVLLLPAKGTKWKSSHHIFKYPSAQTAAFTPRPDVDAALHTTTLSGWRVVMQTNGLSPGDYLLELFAQASGGGEFRPVTKRPFKILSPSQGAAPLTDKVSADLARQAENRLREDQAAAGYWLTSFTKSSVFNDPKQEMNVFLTSVMVDLLDPVATDAGLEGNLARARKQLAGEIEANGLVRYHGRPDSPTISTLGAVITPDADDTALVWRIAGGDDNLLPGVLKTLNSYRTPEGLYRTWLTPRSEYISIDPGNDPNPTDIGIQMHLLMFLNKADTKAAHALYTALQKTIGSDGHWIYYEKTSLVPILRQADLFKEGYPLVLPPSRLKASVSGQEEWIAACHLISRYQTGGPSVPSPQETFAVLKTLAAGDFSLVRSAPPLIYHNDTSAHVPRFYWSADFGYALWLRLYFENMRAHPAASLQQ